MNILDLEEDIYELENSVTTADNVIELASLYIVHEHLKNANTTMVEDELDDILPQYRKYRKIKRKYQLNELTEDAVVDSVGKVCLEIHELIDILYSGTDMVKERKEISKMISSLYKKYGR